MQIVFTNFIIIIIGNYGFLIIDFEDLMHLGVNPGSIRGEDSKTIKGPD